MTSIVVLVIICSVKNTFYILNSYSISGFPCKIKKARLVITIPTVPGKHFITIFPFESVAKKQTILLFQLFHFCNPPCKTLGRYILN